VIRIAWPQYFSWHRYMQVNSAQSLRSIRGGFQGHPMRLNSTLWHVVEKTCHLSELTLRSGKLCSVKFPNPYPDFKLICRLCVP
jgi:hypothetical protein